MKRTSNLKHEIHHLHNVTVNQLLFVIIILAVCSNTVALADMPNNETDCTSRRTCAQCTHAAACKWSFENQSCVTPDKSFPSDIPDKYCFHFFLTNEIHSDPPKTIIAIKLAMSKDETFITSFLRTKEIECEIEEASYAATFEDDGLIVCNYTLPATFYDRITETESAPNPLLIVYFTLVVNGVRWKFDVGRDHYIAVYPHGSIVRGKSCAESSKCYIGYWNDGPVQYYCKWCRDNEGCKIKRQEGKCYARDVERGARLDSGNASVIHVKDDVASIDFFPAVGPVTGGTTVSLMIRDSHRTVAEHREVTMTVAGRECRDPKLEYSWIECTVDKVAEAGAVVVDSGPVVVSFRSPEQQVYVFSSKEDFRFVRPHVTSVRGPHCGPVSSSTLLEVVGQFPSLSYRDVHVSVGERAECFVLGVQRDLIRCLPVPLEGERPDDLAVPVVVTIEGVQYGYEPPFMFRFLDAEPSVDADQTFAGLASGGTRLTARGRWTGCVREPRVYVVQNGTRVYGEAYCEVALDSAVMVCRAPKLSTVTGPVELPIGFQWIYGGKTVETPANGHLYVLSPDPVFTDFRVDANCSDPASANVTIHGLNVDSVPAEDVEVRIPGPPSDGLAGMDCVVCWIDRNHVSCRAPSKSMSGAETLVIVVGTNLSWTVRRKGGDETAAVCDRGPQWLLFCSMCASFLVLISALMWTLRVRYEWRSSTRSSTELRNIVAGMDDE